MYKSTLALLACSILLTAGCSSRSVYESMKARNEIECRKLPPAQYDDCVKAQDTDYEQYKEQRKEVIKDGH